MNNKIVYGDWPLELEGECLDDLIQFLKDVREVYGNIPVVGAHCDSVFLYRGGDLFKNSLVSDQMAVYQRYKDTGEEFFYLDCWNE